VLITRYEHSCIRLEAHGKSIVIDPGIWSEPEALHDTDAVLVTHHHRDHIDEVLLADAAVPVYAPIGMAIASVPFIEVVIGTTIEIAGFEVKPIGGRHAPVVPGQQVCINSGFVIDNLVYHPGDSLHVPDQKIDTVFVPMQASWLKTSEAIDFVNSISPRLAIGMHDGQLNDLGIDAINGWLSSACDSEYRWMTPGTSIALDDSTTNRH